MLVPSLATHETTNPLLPATPDLVWGAIVFVVLFVFFIVIVYPRFTTMLDERRAAIEGNIDKASQLQREAEQALATYTAQLAEARTEAAQIRDQAGQDGGKILAELKQQAQTEAARIVSNAQAQIEAERQQALVSLRQEVGALALDLASGVIGESLSDDRTAAAVVDRFLAELDAEQLDAEQKAKS